MERKEIGKGWEHRVYNSSVGKQRVVKYPNRVNSFILNRFFGGIETVRQELAEAQILIENTPLRIPHTHILPGRRGYVIGQEKIDHDESMDIRNHLMEIRISYLLEKYNSNPENFAASQGVTYWLDPTKSPIPRILDRTGIITSQQWRGVKIRRNTFFNDLKHFLRRK